MPPGFTPSQPTLVPAADRGWRIAGAIYCTLMLGIHIAAGLNCGGIVDFWRDMYWATQIAQGQHFPLSGPPIYELFELGPWWFYLLALPIRLFGSVTAASVLVQMLAAAKYFLARYIGTRWVDARFGFVFAVGIGVAGWSTIAMMFPSHPALVETTILLLALATRRCWVDFSVANALLFGLAAAACIHAHPTAVTYPIVAGVVLLYRHRSVKACALLALAVGVVLLSLLPPWLDSSMAPAGMARPLTKYADHDLGIEPWFRFLPLIRALFIDGAWSGLLLRTPMSQPLAQIALAIYCLCLAFAISGIFLLRSRRSELHRWALAALLMMTAQTIFLVAVRAKTTMWMIPSALPPVALIIAIGWYGLLESGSFALRSAGRVALALYVVLALAPFYAFLGKVDTLRSMAHVNSYTDIGKWGNSYTEVPVTFVPVRQMDRIGALLCAPTVLHASLAWITEHSLSVPARLACGHQPDLRFGGVEGGGRHLAGISKRAARQIGIAPDRIAAGLAFYQHVRAIAPASGGRPTNLPRMQISADRVTSAPVPHQFEFAANAGDVVALTNRFASAHSMIVHSVTANGKPAKLLFDDSATFLYRCADCVDRESVAWRIDLDGIEPNLDLVVIESANRSTNTPNTP